MCKNICQLGGIVLEMYVILEKKIPIKNMLNVIYTHAHTHNQLKKCFNTITMKKFNV